MIEKIFDRNTRNIATIGFILSYIILGYIQIQAAGSILSSILNISYERSIIISGILILLYVSAGGFWSITLTNVLHTFILYFSIVIIFIIGIIKVEGYSGLFIHLNEAGKNIEIYRSMKGIGINTVISWILAGIFGAFAAQASIQPVFAAKDEETARKSSIISSVLIFPVGIMTSTIGMISATGIFGKIENSKLALTGLLTSPTFIPIWLGGIALAGILAAVLSTVAPVIFALSTIIVKDIYHYLINKKADEKKLLKISRLTTIILILILIPLSIIFKGLILDTAYISYAIRSSAAIVIISGLFLKLREKNIITNFSAGIAILGGSIISVLIPIIQYFYKPFKIDKIYFTFAITVFLLILGKYIGKIKRK